MPDKKALQYIGLIAIIFGIIMVAIPGIDTWGWATGYFLGLLAIVLHFLTSFFINDFNLKKFVTYYFVGMFVRLLIVLGLFFILIIYANFEQLSFTVSFLISYILHFVIDVQLLNKKFK